MGSEMRYLVFCMCMRDFVIGNAWEKGVRGFILFCVCALLMMSCLFISGGNHRVNYVSFIRRWS